MAVFEEEDDGLVESVAAEAASFWPLAASHCLPGGRVGCKVFVGILFFWREEEGPGFV